MMKNTSMTIQGDFNINEEGEVIDGVQTMEARFFHP